MTKCRWIKPIDAMVMFRAYDALHEKIHGLCAEDLVDKIEFRAFTEFCLDLERVGDLNSWLRIKGYRGEGFDEWVRDEIHYALERAGFKWIKEENRFCGNGDVADAYRLVREKVLQTIVVKAAELFREWDGKSYPKTKDDKRYLRGSLATYLS